MKKTIITILLLILFIPIVVNAETINISSIEEFVDAVTNTGGELKLESNISLTGNTFIRKDTVLDLNGHTLEVGNYTLVNYSKTELKDTGNGGKVTGTKGFIIQNGASTPKGATFTITSGTIEGIGEDSYGFRTFETAIMNGGTIKAYSFTTYLQGPFTLNNGTIYGSNGIAVQVMDNALFTMNNGTVKTDSKITAINLHGNCEAVINDGEILATEKENANGIAAFKNTTLTINGGTITAKGNAITGNGSISGDSEGTNAKFTITNGNITSINGAAVYAPQPEGVTTITGGTFTGRNGLEIRAGKLVIEDGLFTSTDSEYTVIPNTNGVTTMGSAVSVAQHTTHLPVDVTICGGTFNGPIPFVQVNALSLAPEVVALIKLDINNTCNKLTMNSTDPEYTVYSENITDFVTGGLFTRSVNVVIPDGYVEIDTDGMKEVVKPHNITIITTGEGTASASKSVSPKNQEIELTINTADDYRYDLEVKDSHGNVINVTDKKFIMPDDDVTVTVNFVKRREVVVTFQIHNGHWINGTVQDITVTIVENDEGKLILDESQIPVDMKADEGFTSGSWNQLLNGEIEVDGDTTFVYEFAKDEIGEINPETVDRINIYNLMFVISTIGLISTIVYKRR